MYKELRFALYAIRKFLQSSAELRTSFLMNIFGMFINNTAFIVMWMAFSHAVGTIGGWTAIDIIALESYAALSLGTVFFFFGGIQKLPQYVLSGSFDRFLLSPKNPLLRMMTSHMMVSAFGDIIFGIAGLVLYAVLGGLNLTSIVMLVLGGILGVFAFLATSIGIFSVSFFIMDTNIVSRGLFELYFTPSMYHGGAFSSGLRAFFTYVIPSLLVAILPVEATRNQSWETLGFIALLGCLWFALSVYIFHLGIRKYESANFMTFGT